MSELEMKTEVEADEFTDELSDEALDRAKGAAASSNCASFSIPKIENDMSDVLFR